jgi:hypothetical protein
MHKICARPTCGTAFDTPNVNRAYCSPDCRNWKRVQIANQYRRQQADTQRRHRHEADLAECGLEPTPALIAFGELRYKRGYVNGYRTGTRQERAA